MTTSPDPPTGFIFTKASMTTPAEITILLPRTESSMSALSETRACSDTISMRHSMTTRLWFHIGIGSIPFVNASDRGWPRDVERRIVPAQAGGRFRMVILGHLIENFGVVGEGNIAVSKSFRDIKHPPILC